MIDRRFEVIEKDENQELSKILACAEQHLTCVEFGRKTAVHGVSGPRRPEASSSQERKSTTVCSRSTTP